MNKIKSIYTVFRGNFIKKNQSYGKNGGVAMYVSDNIKWNRRLDLKNETIECIWIEINPENEKSFLIGCIYIPQIVCYICLETGLNCLVICY